jgi:glutathione S-transferase
MTDKLVLISHRLCPDVQRAAIALAEKGVPFERVDIDLDAKPDWFLRLSPLGKVPVLKVGDNVIFESAVILEYLEDTRPNPLHPADPLVRAEHRSWIEFGSSVLADLWGFYTAPDAEAFAARTAALAAKFARLEARIGEGPFFDGARFSLVDAAFGPVFRYFDVFDGIADFGILAGKPKVAAWRRALATRPSVQAAVSADYPDRLRRFVRGKGAHLASLLADAERTARLTA